MIEKRLGKLGLGPHREEEILRELCEHLADHAATLEARGVARDAAAQQAFDSVSNWPELRNEIVSAETEEAIMNYRTKVVWLPALCALALSNVLLALMQVFGPPHFYWFYTGKGMAPYYVFVVPWLITQPAVGGIAAYWSRRAGGAVLHQLLSALAPAIALLGVFVLILPFAMIMEEGHYLHLGAFLILTVTWVVLPALPLLVGAAPFLRNPQPHS